MIEDPCGTPGGGGGGETRPAVNYLSGGEGEDAAEGNGGEENEGGRDGAGRMLNWKGGRRERIGEDTVDGEVAKPDEDEEKEVDEGRMGE